MSSLFTTEEERRRKRQIRMLRRGKRFAFYLPDGYTLSAVDPGYLFVHPKLPPLSLPDFLVHHLLEVLSD